MAGHIFDIQRFCLHDGPGIRTTVFLKGCLMRCWWCCNPESIDPKPQLSYMTEKCIACGACFPACKPGALAKNAGGKAIADHARCTNCGDCVRACDPRALELVGRDVTAGEVMDIVMRDRDYYEQSGGGLTLSGGEPLLQSEFIEELLHAAKNQGLHCCVETCGYAGADVVERLKPAVDYWLFDYKETDPALHAKFTGRELETILARLQQLHDGGAKILVRCPMIPECNARPDHLDGIAELARRLPNLLGVELLPYFDLWRPKLKRFGLTTALPDTVKPPSRELFKSWNDYLRRRGVHVIG